MRTGVLVLLAACHARLGDPGDTAIDGSSIPDPVDGTPGDDAATSIDAAPLGVWGPVTKIPGVTSSTSAADDSTMSWHGTELVYALSASGNKKHLFTMSYANGVFGTPAPLPFSSTNEDESPRFSTDDLTLYFASDRNGVSLDVYATHRATIGGAWSTPLPVQGPNTGGIDKWYAPCDGDRYLVVSENGATGTDVYEGIVGAAPALVSRLSSPASEISTFLTKDCLTAYFASQRDGATLDLWTSTRTSVNNEWATPTLVLPFSTTDHEEDPWISPDQRMFTFARAPAATPAQKALYFSVR